MEIITISVDNAVSIYVSTIHDNRIHDKWQRIFDSYQSVAHSNRLGQNKCKRIISVPSSSNTDNVDVLTWYCHLNRMVRHADHIHDEQFLIFHENMEQSTNFVDQIIRKYEAKEQLLEQRLIEM